MSHLVDGHTHMFNVGFLPIEGIVLSRVDNADLADAIAALCERLVETERLEPASGLTGFAGERARLYERVQEELDAEELTHTSEFIAEFVELVPPEDMEFLRHDLHRGASSVGKQSPAEDGRANLKAILEWSDDRLGEVETSERRAIRGKSVGSLIRWLLTLIIHESRIEEASRRYWKHIPPFQIRVHHMMDMELHYESRRVLYDRRERQQRMRTLQANAVGLVGFVAYSPFREHAVDIVQHAIEEEGFSGVKFYPPNGYRPIDNKPDDIVDGPSAAEVNARNLDLFHYCADPEKDVPIFTHCTSTGMESRPGHTGCFSNPKGWETVLNTEGLSSLRLCFGHAGGQDGWLAQSDADFENSYAGKVVYLCETFDNVYCDFGYFDKLLQRDSADVFRHRLDRVFESHEQFRRRCCFGSDWHLIAMEKHAKEFGKIFADLVSPSLRDAVMGGNAASFLKL